MSTEPDQPPAISVIVPALNAGAYLQRSLEAIFASQGPSYECILVDDGSTDDSASMALQLGARVIHVSEGPLGPAHARNRGVEAARGSLIFFVDADVVLARGALRRVVTLFQERADVAAVFGSYDNHPAAPGVVSRYRNLLHHFVHQNGNREASTFWAGCGAIRRSVFEKIGGFDEQRFSRASIEDIELGYRLRGAGYRILLDKGLYGTHLKRWSLWSMIRTDITCRAIPWSRLALEAPQTPQDLNLQPAQKASVAMVGLACAFLIVALAWPQSLALSALAVAGVVLLNRRLYALFWCAGGLLFVAACIPLHLLYYLYSGLSYFYVWTEFAIKKLTNSRRRPNPQPKAKSIKVQEMREPGR
jgi:glycosyltransferase involved in cell wall biosynthesis